MAKSENIQTESDTLTGLRKELEGKIEKRVSREIAAYLSTFAGAALGLAFVLIIAQSTKIEDLNVRLSVMESKINQIIPKK